MSPPPAMMRPIGAEMVSWACMVRAFYSKMRVMDLQTLGKTLTVAAAVIAVLGGLLWVGGHMGLGALPGDIRIQREGWSCYFPIVTSIVVSVALTLLVGLLLKVLR